jgi:hypothetical protein
MRRASLARADAILDRIGLWITNAVGTMWCSILFAAIAFYGLPDAIRTGQLVPWFAQTFLQLVLLSIIMVGGRLQSVATEKLIRETHENSADDLRDTREILSALLLIANALHVHLTGKPHPAADLEGLTDESDPHTGGDPI